MNQMIDCIIHDRFHFGQKKFKLTLIGQIIRGNLTLFLFFALIIFLHIFPPIYWIPILLFSIPLFGYFVALIGFRREVES